MKQTRLLLLGAAALTLCGCGGGGSSAPSGSSDALSAGRAAINNMASGSQPTSPQSLQSALTLFQQAEQQNPGSSQAYFGAAIALAGICGQQMDDITAGGGSGNSGSASAGSASTGTVSPASKAASAAHTRLVMPPPPPTVTGSTTGGAVSNGPNIPAAPTTGALPPTPPTVTGSTGGVMPPQTLGLVWNLDQSLSNPYTLLQTLAPISDLHLGLIPFSGYANDAQDVARRQQLLTNLGTVLTDLQTVEADSSFSYTLPAPDQNGQTVTIGLPEVYLFDAYVNSLRAQVALSLAYVRDPGNWTPAVSVIPVSSGGSTGSGIYPPAPPVFSNSAGSSGATGAGSGSGSSIASVGSGVIGIALPIINYSALDTNHDGKLEPNEYLPPSPFLTLRNASYLQTAQQSLAATAAKETLGINGVLARTSGGPYLIPNTTRIAQILTDIKTNVVPLIAQAATGPVTLNVPHYAVETYGVINEGSDSAGGVFQYIPSVGTTADTPPPPPAGNAGTNSGTASGIELPSGVTVTQEQVTINLAAWFANPPQDLKAFAPTYTLTASGGIDPTKTTYPDPTFGGLFPKGLPQDLQL